MPTEPQAGNAVQSSDADTPTGAPAPAGADVPAQDTKPVKKIVRGALAVLVAMFLYHLVADRFTPYTSQATVDTFLVEVAPEISGPVASVAIADNQSVKKGQVLFQLDPLPFEIALRSAEANLAVATQNVDASAADVRVADAQLQRQRVDLAATQQLGKIVLDLSAKRALSETSAIRARADMAKTRADIVRAQAEAERARIRLGGGVTANPQVLQAMISVEQAALDLRRTAVVAPADGAVTNLRLAPGQFASRGQPVLSFMADGPRWVTAAMRENQLGNIARGNRAYVVFDDHPGKVFPARVDSVGWGIAQGGESPDGKLPRVEPPNGWLREPQRFPVRIVLEESGDAAELPPGRSGAQANVVIQTRERSLMNPLARLWIWLVAHLSYLQ